METPRCVCNQDTYELAAKVVQHACAHNQRLATAESCTGGLVSAALTSVSGSSAVVRGGIVSYAIEVKHEVLDVDAVRVVSKNISDYHNENNALILITHLNQILKFIRPEFVHVLIDGRIVREGGPELVEEIETNGFDAYRKEV